MKFIIFYLQDYVFKITLEGTFDSWVPAETETFKLIINIFLFSQKLKPFESG